MDRHPASRNNRNIKTPSRLNWRVINRPLRENQKSIPNFVSGKSVLDMIFVLSNETYLPNEYV